MPGAQSQHSSGLTAGQHVGVLVLNNSLVSLVKMSPTLRAIYSRVTTLGLRMGAWSRNTGLWKSQPEVNVPLDATGGQPWGPCPGLRLLPLLYLVWTSKQIKKAPGFICMKYFTSLLS